MDETKKRILIVDSNPAIHEDFHKIFSGHGDKQKNSPPSYLIDSAYDSEQALHHVQQAVQEQRPYTIAFMDLYSNASWDGIKTAQRLWEADPNLHFVLGNAYSTYSWQDLTHQLPRADLFLILNKPFDLDEIRQLVFYLSRNEDADAKVNEHIHALQEKIKFLYTYIYPKNDPETLSRRAELMNTFPQALRDNQFVLHYQPLVKANSSQILGLEALIRWQHPAWGLLYPQEFLTAAEEAGFIVKLGEWVLKTAFAKVKRWQETIYPGLFVAVNISSYQLCQPGFEEVVLKLLKKAELEPHYVELEIIAHPILMGDPDVLKRINRLKESGVRFSLNNFGAGYANLDYLQSFPFDKVKIDRGFVKNIQPHLKENKAIEAILYFAKKMGVQVVAEGVETQDQVEFLFNHHGEQMQGYYFSPPLTEEACAVLLEKQRNRVKEEG